MRTPNFNDAAQCLIAVIMIVGFIYLTYLLLLPATPNADLIELLAAVFGGWIGAIIGFYFGQRPVKMLTETVEEKAKDIIKLNETVVEKTTGITTRQETINNLSAKLAQLLKEFEGES